MKKVQKTLLISGLAVSAMMIHVAQAATKVAVPASESVIQSVVSKKQ